LAAVLALVWPPRLSAPPAAAFSLRRVIDFLAMYYVSVIDGPRIGGEIEVKRMGLLAGPYETHEEALDRVDEVRKIAEEINAWAHFYAFGTVKLKDLPYPDGRLNHLLHRK
jgi:hypothetical protein